MVLMHGGAVKDLGEHLSQGSHFTAETLRPEAVTE